MTEITAVRDEWMAQWKPLLNSNEAPISPYRVIWELMAGTDPKNTIITHDAGSPRDQISPFWVSTEPMSYIGWGKTTQLGMGLGLAMGAKLAQSGQDSASTSGAMRRSASPAWTSRPRCASAFRSCPS